MNPPVAPGFRCDKVHPTLSVADVRSAVDFYVERLGFWLGFVWGDPPTTAGVNLGKVQLMMNQGTPSPAGWSVYFVVDDVDAMHAFHQAHGVDVLEAPADRPWGLREFAVRDLHGHELRFGQHLPEREPKLEIERVDVPVRLERRLAAVLLDLAAYKRMSVAECLEETLLHTFERSDGGGVPSPHSESTLAHIQELKQKHGIDYGCHASYRFLEKNAPAP
jgi:uncharacterized glyoxalase superfamily protein PhnB